ILLSCMVATFVSCEYTLGYHEHGRSQVFFYVDIGNSYNGDWVKQEIFTTAVVNTYDELLNSAFYEDTISYPPLVGISNELYQVGPRLNDSDTIPAIENLE